MKRPLDGQVVIVTGGGTGIGLACALALADAGARVTVAGRRAAPLEKVAAENEGVVGVQADVRHEVDVARVVADTVARWGRIDAVVNNAGAFAASALEDTTAERVRSLFETNVLGPTLLVREALPYLEASRGAVVNVSSTFGHRPAAMIAHYAASKAALEMLTRSWALELAPKGIRVNAVAPGPTETPILQESGLPPEAVEQIRRREREQNPLGRRGEPEEVAFWISSLLGPRAAWVTGQIVAVDGGLSVA